jgi:hypothetical protein
MRYTKALATLRAELLGPKKIPLKVPGAQGIRTRAVEILLDLMDRTNGRIKSAGKKAQAGSGGVSEFVRLCQLQGYLIQVLDGVLKNLPDPEIERRLRELEKIAAAAGGAA